MADHHHSSFALTYADRTSSEDSFVTAPEEILSDTSDYDEENQDFLFVPLLPELQDMDFTEPYGSSQMAADLQGDDMSDGLSAPYSDFKRNQIADSEGPSFLYEEERELILSNEPLLHILFDSEDLSSSSDDDDGDDSSNDTEMQDSEGIPAVLDRFRQLR
ncbi:MAG: hypothetical protein Q9184_007523 [Pyrenodesmia sp. 2 TL-2023]